MKNYSIIYILTAVQYYLLEDKTQEEVCKIPKEKYENIFKGAYERPEKYVPNNKIRKKIINDLGRCKNRRLKCKNV
jgi:hypothetical protein